MNKKRQNLLYKADPFNKIIIPEPFNTVPSKMEGIKTEGSKSERSKSEGAKKEGSVMEGSKTEGTKLECSEREASQSEPIKTISTKTEASILEPFNAEGIKTEDIDKKEGLFYSGHYFCIENDITQLMQSMKDKYKISPSTILLYIAYLRGSWGFHKNYYNSGDKNLMESSFIDGKGTFYRCKQELFNIGLIQEINASNKRTSNYDCARVFAPHEMLEKLGIGAKTTLKSESNNTPKTEASISEGIKMEPSETERSEISVEGSKIEPSILAPIKYNINKNIIKRNSLSEGGETNLVDEFYEGLCLKPSSIKKESDKETLQKLQKEYSPDEIKYGFKYVAKCHSDTKSLSRLPYLMDSAMKTRQEEEAQAQKEADKLLELKKNEAETAKALLREHEITLLIQKLSDAELAPFQQEVDSVIKAERVPAYLLERVRQNKIRELVATKYLRVG